MYNILKHRVSTGVESGRTDIAVARTYGTIGHIGDGKKYITDVRLDYLFKREPYGLVEASKLGFNFSFNTAANVGIKIY